jgi:hypothetical protein
VRRSRGIKEKKNENLERIEIKGKGDKWHLHICKKILD